MMLENNNIGTRIRIVLQRLARTVGCYECGTHSHDVKYCWHHPGKKNFQVSWSSSMGEAAEELELCIPLCVPCHARLHRTGKKMSLESRAKVSAAQKGRKHSPETRKKISAAKMGRKRKPFTPEHCANISAAAQKSSLRKSLTLKHRAKISDGLKKYWKKEESLNDQLDKLNDEYDEINKRLVQLKKKQNGELGDYTVVTF